MLPVGCNTFEDWLLDAMSVEKVLKNIALGGNVDLITACTVTSAPTTFKALSPRPSTPGKSPRGPGGSPANGREGAAMGAAHNIALVGEDEEGNTGIPQLELKSLKVGE